MKLTLAGVVLLLVGVAFPQDQNCSVVQTKDLIDSAAPKFDDYKVPSPKQEVIPQLDITSHPMAKTYRTVLREEIRKGPNFAGFYRVAAWGCGSSCAMFAVVNLVSGRVITVAGINTVSGGNFLADDFLPDAPGEGWGFRFRKNSGLLVLVGALNEDEARQGAFYLEMKHDRLTLIHQTLVKKTCSR